MCAISVKFGFLQARKHNLQTCAAVELYRATSATVSFHTALAGLNTSFYMWERLHLRLGGAAVSSREEMDMMARYMLRSCSGVCTPTRSDLRSEKLTAHSMRGKCKTWIERVSGTAIALIHDQVCTSHLKLGAKKGRVRRWISNTMASFCIFASWERRFLQLELPGKCNGLSEIFFV